MYDSAQKLTDSWLLSQLLLRRARPNTDRMGDVTNWKTELLTDDSAVDQRLAEMRKD